MPLAVDGLSGVILAVLAAVGIAGPWEWRRGVAVLAAMLAAVATDGVVFVIAIVGAVGVSRPRREVAAIAVLGVVVAMLALGGLDPRFASMRGAAPEGVRAVLVLAAALAAVAALPFALAPELGGVLAILVAARVLLDLAGAVTPGWWGVPTLALAAAGVVCGGWRLSVATEIGEAAAAAALAAAAIALQGLGAALLARGADLLPVAALGVSGALLQLLAWSLWGGLLALCGAAIHAMAGGSLVRLGGLLRRVPATGLALLVAVASMAAVPASAGFAGLWLVLQALFGVSRGGGPGVALLVAGIVAAMGLGGALLAVGAVRLGGAVLLGGPRSAKAAAATEPRRRVRLLLAAYVVAVLLLGVCPGLGTMLLAPAVRLLAGAAAEGGGLLLLGGAADGPGYAAPVVAVLLVAGVAIAGWIVARGGPSSREPGWQGGFAEDAVGARNGWAIARPRVPAWPDWRVLAGAGLALALAAVLGWALR